MRLPLTITSPAFQNNEYIPQKYTCDGYDHNPELEISQVPESTKSLVLVMEDPDAPSGVFIHWLVWNISPETKIIEAGKPPQGSVEAMTSFGKTSYGGPCPPHGKPHRYYFKVFALAQELDLPKSSRALDVYEHIHNHVIATAELVGLYRRESGLY